MKRTYAARKYRQVKWAISQLEKLLSSSDLDKHETIIQRLKQKIKHLLQAFHGTFSSIQLKKMLSGLAILLVSFSSNQLHAQHYFPAVPSPAVIDNTVDKYVDLDLDGDLDVLQVIKNTWFNSYTHLFYYSTYIKYQLNTVVNDVSNFGSSVTILNSNFDEHIAISLADIDSDGDMDIIVNRQCHNIGLYAYDQWNTLSYYKNNGINGGVAYVSTPLVSNFLDPRYSREPIMNDLDDDGDLDLSMMVSGSGPFGYSGVQYFQNIGSQTVPNFNGSVLNPFNLSPIPGGTSKFEYLDLNLDGDLDLFAIGPNSIYQLENIGSASTPNFSAPIANPFGLTIGTGNSIGEFIDFDQDNDLDFVTSGSNGDFKFFENTGTTSAVFGNPIIDPFCINLVTEINPQITVGDFNGDGDLDIMSRLSFYENAPLSVVSSTTSSTFCGSTTELSATSTNGTINWYDAPNGGNLLGTGTSFTTPSITVPTNFYAAVTDGNCESPRTAVLASPTACTKLKSWYCDRYLINFNDYMGCDAVPGATSYRFEMDDGINTYFYENPTGGMRFNLVPGIKYGTSYTVKAAAKINGEWLNYGTGCNVTTPLTQMQPWYCGLTVNPMNQYLACYEVSEAGQYKFKLVNGQTTLYYTSNSIGFRMSLVPGIQTNTTYQVSVSSYTNGLWAPYGPACAITSAAVMGINPGTDGAFEENPNDLMHDLSVQLFPNPTSGNFTLFLDQSYEQVEVTITDLQGKIIQQQTANDASELNFDIQQAEGVYLVTVRIDGRETKVLKLVKN